MRGRFCATIVSLCAAGAFAQDPALEPGRPMARDIDGGGTHAYRLPLKAGQYIHVTAEQSSVNVMLCLDGPDNRQLAEVNRNTIPGREDIFWVAADTGEFTLRVRADEGKPGRYVIELRKLGPPDQLDRNRFEAYRKTYVEAEPLRVADTAVSIRQAIAKYEESLPLWKAAGEQAWEAYTHAQLGNLYSRLGQLPRARDSFLAALPLYRAAGERLHESMMLNSAGGLCDRLGERDRALEYLDQALRLRRELGYRRGEAITLNNIGLAYEHLGKRGEALDYFRKSLEIRREVGDTTGEAVTLDNLALSYRRAGQLQQALETTIASLKLRRAAKDRRGEGTTLNAMGIIYASLGELDKALEYWKQALPIFEEVGDTQGLASVLADLGVVSSNRRQYKEAVPYLERAVALRHQASNKSAEANALTTLAAAFSGRGEQTKALETAERALDISRQIGYRFGVADAHRWIGQIQARMGNWDKARDELREAVAENRAAGNVEQLSLSLAALAGVERETRNFTPALAYAEEALGLSETQRMGVANPESRAAYRAHFAPLYALKVDILMAMHEADPSGGFAARAIEANERSRALSLIEMLNDPSSDLRQELTADQRRRESEILKRISGLQREILQGKAAPARERDLKQQLAATERELELYQVELRAAGSRYAAVQYAPALGPDRIRNEVLGAHTALVEYALGEQRSYVWVLSANGLASAVLPARDRIEEMAAAYRQELSQRVSALTANAAMARIAQQSAALYRTLVAPVEKALAGNQRLILVADGALAYVPFETLANPAPLIESYSIAYAPSASTLAVLQTRKRRSPTPAKTLLAFADPELGNASRTQAFAAERGLDLARLPNARSEVTVIRSLYAAGQTQAYIGPQATEQRLKTEDLRKYRFLHFATHGYFDEERPGRSGILLAPGDDPAHDGILQVGEIMHLELDADMVTLSACQTGLGRVLAGEGVIGLTRSFLYAGAESVVVSLWNVNDSATAELMKVFYRELRTGAPRPEALRKAKLSLVRGTQPTWRHPYYWAPFVYVGR